ncbi:MAG: deoxyribonuclease V [Chloroflexi bacterium]|nr:deoxyribonuclease V [Chloroflexota bacterium]
MRLAKVDYHSYNGAVRSRSLHPWNVTVAEAQAIQWTLASQVSKRSELSQELRYIAGTDISNTNKDGVAQAAVVVLSYPDMDVVEVRKHRGRPGFPYVPGLLSFRESPLILEALEKLSITPDLLLVDGQGLAHPRRLGIACHLGLLTNLPTIGCAKSRLIGHHWLLAREAGSWVKLEDQGEVVGAVVRTRDDTSPLYISIGHKVDLDAAINWTLACCRGYRTPEPTRLAHHAAGGAIPEKEFNSGQGLVVQQGSLL